MIPILKLQLVPGDANVSRKHAGAVQRGDPGAQKQLVQILAVRACQKWHAAAVRVQDLLRFAKVADLVANDQLRG